MLWRWVEPAYQTGRRKFPRMTIDGIDDAKDAWGVVVNAALGGPAVNVIDNMLGGGGGPIDEVLEEVTEDSDVSRGDHDPLPAFNSLLDLNFDTPEVEEVHVLSGDHAVA